MSTEMPTKEFVASEASSTEEKSPSVFLETPKKGTKTVQRSGGGQQSTSSKKVRTADPPRPLTCVKEELDVRTLFRSDAPDSNALAAFAAASSNDDGNVTSPEKIALKQSNSITNLSTIVIYCFYHCGLLHTAAWTGKTFSVASLFQNRVVDSFENESIPAVFFKKRADLPLQLKKIQSSDI